MGSAPTVASFQTECAMKSVNDCPEYVEMPEIEGRTIERWGRMFGARDRAIIYFDDGGCVTISTVADCCNDVWFEHIEDVGVSGGKVIGLHAKPGFEVSDDEMVGNQECEDVFLFTIKTTKGDLDFEMRNSSNGYYSGTCVFDFFDARGVRDAPTFDLTHASRYY